MSVEWDSKNRNEIKRYIEFFDENRIHILLVIKLKMILL